MGIEYEELLPVEATITVKGKEYTLAPFSLAAQVWAKNYFATEEESDGLKNLLTKLDDVTKNPEPVLRVTWYLLRDKGDFGTFENFVESFDGRKKWLNIAKLYPEVMTTIGVSQPALEEIRDELEIKKH